MVKLLVCGYVLYKGWALLFNGRLSGLWDRIPVRPEKETPVPAATAATEEDAGDVVGKTRIEYLEDPELAAKVPAYSEKLELSGFMGEEPEISDDDVDSDLSPEPKTPEEILEEQYRFEAVDDLTPGFDPDFSTGLTYEEMANAVGVLTVATDDEKQIIEAATTIHRIRDTDLFEFFTNQVSNLDNVEKLMNDCLDDNGKPLTVRKSKRTAEGMEPFDMGKYV
ncbi:MAG: DUF4122 domain-containing protein [Prevotella sp.]|nr:DUF4122 domain-containing protein [Prevotella sp.]